MEQRNVNIQLVRIVSMFFILFCHFFNEIGNGLAALGQFFNVGVFIFFIISAYLYGKKSIKNSRKWLLKKILQISIPIYIWLICVNAIYLVTNTEVVYKNNIFYILNIQAFVKQGLQGLQHLWFVSIIMIMYLLTPILNKIKSKEFNKYQITCIIFMQIFSFVALSLITETWGRYLFYIFLYIDVFGVSSKEKYNMNINKWLLIIILIIAASIRMAFKLILDNTIIYSNFIVLPTQAIIGACIFEIFKNLKLNFRNKNFIDCLDGITYYVYIVHYIFCVGPLKIIQSFSILYPLQIIVIILLSIILGTILKFVTDKINNNLLGVE